MGSVVELTELLAGSRLARLAAIASLDESRASSYDGYTSVTAFLIHRCGMSGRAARREVFLARSLPHMEYAVKSTYAGHIAISQLESWPMPVTTIPNRLQTTKRPSWTPCRI